MTSVTIRLAQLFNYDMCTYPIHEYNYINM